MFVSRLRPDSLTRRERRKLGKRSGDLKHTYRPLTSADGDAFRELLTAVYGSSYSHSTLYQPGSFETLIQSKRIESFGEWTPDGKLVAHTAFIIKDPNKSDYVEQGMAFKHPTLLSRTTQADPRALLQIFKSFCDRVSFIHQNVTTYHPLAQGFAYSALRARATGLIFHYAPEEHLRRYDTASKPMTALIMTSALPKAFETRQVVHLPKTAWGRWLSKVYETFNLERELRWIEADETVAGFRAPTPVFSTIDEIPAFGLKRLKLDSLSSTETSNESSNRVALAHVALDQEALVAQAFQALSMHGFVPVGIRPQAKRPDEVIFQKMTAESLRELSDLNEAHFHRDEDAKWVNEWRRLCETR